MFNALSSESGPRCGCSALAKRAQKSIRKQQQTTKDNTKGIRKQQSSRKASTKNRTTIRQQSLFKATRFPFLAAQVFRNVRFTYKNTVFSDESLSERSAKKGSKKAPKTATPGQIPKSSRKAAKMQQNTT